MQLLTSHDRPLHGGRGTIGAVALGRSTRMSPQTPNPAKTMGGDFQGSAMEGSLSLVAHGGLYNA